MRYVSEVLQDKDMNVFPESVTDNSIKCIMDSCNAMGDKFLTPLCVNNSMNIVLLHSLYLLRII